MHDGKKLVVSALQDGSDTTLTHMCHACGASGLPACACASLPKDVCDGDGNKFYCEGSSTYREDDRLFCS